MDQQQSSPSAIACLLAALPIILSDLHHYFSAMFHHMSVAQLCFRRPDWTRTSTLATYAVTILCALRGLLPEGVRIYFGFDDESNERATRYQNGLLGKLIEFFLIFALLMRSLAVAIYQYEYNPLFLRRVPVIGRIQLLRSNINRDHDLGWVEMKNLMRKRAAIRLKDSSVIVSTVQALLDRLLETDIIVREGIRTDLYVVRDSCKYRHDERSLQEVKLICQQVRLMPTQFLAAGFSSTPA